MTLDIAYHHAGVSVPDLEAAVRWYGEVLGFEVERRFHIDKARAEVAMLRRGPLRFELFQLEEAQALPEDRRHPVRDLQTHGNKHTAFVVPDLDRALEHFDAHGVEVVMVVREAFGQGCFVRDCCGNLLEFVVQPPPVDA